MFHLPSAFNSSHALVVSTDEVGDLYQTQITHSAIFPLMVNRFQFFPNLRSVFSEEGSILQMLNELSSD